MKAKQLIEQLQKFPPEEEIYLASDEEGNQILAVNEVVILEGDHGADRAVIYPTGTVVEY